MSMKTPNIRVGIMSDKGIAFTLKEDYTDQEGQQFSKGEWLAVLQGRSIVLSKEEKSFSYTGEVSLEPIIESGSFELHDVTIGINFHWERKENQVFKGGLKFLIEQNLLTYYNLLKHQ